jgi:hypothetical protein
MLNKEKCEMLKDITEKINVGFMAIGGFFGWLFGNRTAFFKT